MAGTLVDSNVLLDLFTEDPRWCDWSETRLADALDRGATLINPIVYAEISTGFERIEELEQALPAELEREALPWEAAFLAGKCFIEYRRRGGQKRSPLPDFYIGAHAAVTGRALLTRDPRRYRSFFPRLELISP
ncbi:MAG: type II toxin-antitoxin system VapC family toxin [Mycobacterium sp.]|uniref:type II toxin-antitoxin system VapC family toxin n=1 Tax=Mycobacterium sp. TaxID=1785 RepID=UPI001EC6309F|nr:type II toxin-antitoxin system VapC family toxin [Mycobacterium sp.]MBW0017670.1 type II toxin-antitoxin system VapC family toxin [Mycobacterium sp.]